MPTTHLRLCSSLLVCLALSGCARGGRTAAAIADPAPSAHTAEADAGAAETRKAEPRADDLPAPTDQKSGKAARPSLPGPMMRLDEFKAMVFAVIDGIERREDLTQANVERITRLKLMPISSEPGVHDIAGPGADDWWRWNVNIANHTRNDPQLELFAGPYEIDRLGNSRHCTYDFQEIDEHLKRQGYKAVVEHNFKGPSRWRYGHDRGDKVVWISLYRSDPLPDEWRCVESVQIAFAMTIEELRHGRSR